MLHPKVSYQSFAQSITLPPLPGVPQESKAHALDHASDPLGILTHASVSLGSMFTSSLTFPTTNRHHDNQCYLRHLSVVVPLYLIGAYILC